MEIDMEKLTYDAPLFHLVAVRGKETFGLTLAGNNLSHAMAKARRVLTESGYAVHPAPTHVEEPVALLKAA
jgi:hypothetical protein